MINLIKSEIYKIRHSKTYKGLLLFIMLLSVCNVISGHIGGDLQLIYADIGNSGFGYRSNIFMDPSNPKGIEFFASSLVWTPIIIVGAGYIVSSLTCDEYTNGTYDNLLSYGHSRIKVYCAKFIAMCIGSTIVIFTLSFLALIIGVIAGGLGVEFKIKYILDMIKLLSLNSIIIISIGSILMVIGTVIKNKALLVTITIVLILSPIFLLENNFELLRYYPPFMIMETCGVMLEANNIKQMLITCLLITVSSISIGSFIFTNQDIK